MEWLVLKFSFLCHIEHLILDSKTILTLLGAEFFFFFKFSIRQAFFYVKGRYLQIFKKYKFLRSLWFFENEKEIELNSQKFTYSAAKYPFSKIAKNGKSLHPTVQYSR